MLPEAVPALPLRRESRRAIVPKAAGLWPAELRCGTGRRADRKALAVLRRGSGSWDPLRIGCWLSWRPDMVGDISPTGEPAPQGPGKRLRLACGAAARPSKLMNATKLLARTHRASIAELGATTGWQTQGVRALL